MCYARLRLLHLEDRVVDARELYRGYDGIGFVKKRAYSADELMRTADGDIIVVAIGDEPFAELAAWPQRPDYLPAGTGAIGRSSRRPSTGARVGEVWHDLGGRLNFAPKCCGCASRPRRSVIPPVLRSTICTRDALFVFAHSS
jgi:hypothetical protein